MLGLVFIDYIKSKKSEDTFFRIRGIFQAYVLATIPQVKRFVAALKMVSLIKIVRLASGIDCFCQLTVNNHKITGKRERKPAMNHIFRAETCEKNVNSILLKEQLIRKACFETFCNYLELELQIRAAARLIFLDFYDNY